jgi:hypothetical protein
VTELRVTARIERCCPTPRRNFWNSHQAALVIKKRAKRERRRFSMSASQDDQHRTVVTTQRARQAVTGHNVRYVLGFGLAAIIIAFAIIYIVYFA